MTYMMKKTFEQISKECDENKNYIIGYELGKTLKNKNKANRGFIEEKDGDSKSNEREIEYRENFFIINRNLENYSL